MVKAAYVVCGRGISNGKWENQHRNCGRIPMEYMADAMVLDGGDGAMTYSHIIRKDGSYVVRSGSAFREDYFRVLKKYLGNTTAKRRMSMHGSCRMQWSR